MMRLEGRHVWVIVVNDCQLQTPNDVIKVTDGRSCASGTVLRVG